MKYILDLIADHINTNQLQQAYDLIITHEEKLIQNAEYWNLRGVLCLKVEEYNAAISCLSKAIELDDQIGDFYYNYAYAFDKIGSQSDAALYYGKAYKYLMDLNIKHELAQLYTDNEALKNIFITASTESKKTYIILSSNIWSNVYQRTHHIARSLYKFGNEVMYVERKRTFTSEQGNIQIEDLVNYSANSVKEIEGVNVYQTLEMLDKYGDSSVDNYLELVQYLLDSCLSQSKEVVIISYLPSQANTIKSLKGEFYHIYECVDDHSDLEYSFWGHKNDIVWEQDLMDSADAITTTATALYLQRSAIEGRNNVFLSRNAVNEFDFLEPSLGEIPNDLIDIPEPRVVYAGAIYEWFDFDLFNKVVESNPDKSFVIIGFGKTELITKRYPNLYFLGERKHSELKRYLKHMQVGIIPFKDKTNIIINCDPIKLYEYLASLLPVVTTYMPEATLGKAFTKIADNPSDFSQAINESLNMDVNVNVISDFMANNNWNARAALLASLADKRINTVKYRQCEEKNINKLLLELTQKQKSSIFLTLYSMSCIYSNKDMYKEGLEQAYENQHSLKFIEKQYLISLYNSGDFEKLNIIYNNSTFFREELAVELEYRLKANDYDRLRSLVPLMIKDAMLFSRNLRDLEKNNFGRTIEYANYLYELGDLKGALDIYWSTSKESYIVQDSPLASYNLSCILAKIKNNRSNYFKERYEVLTNKSSNVVRENHEMKNITILIFTRNRPALLERCIVYFLGLENINVTLRVLDASDASEKDIILNFLGNVELRNIIYTHFDVNSNFADRIYEVLPEITDEYCAICADDDFLGEDGMISSIEIMENNEDIVTVKGRSYVYLNNDISKFLDFPKDSCEKLVDDNPFERIKRLASNWMPQLIYLAFRKEKLEILMRLLVREDVKNLPPVFIEYLMYFAIPLLGKVENTDSALNYRDLSTDSEGHSSSGFIKYIEDGTFLSHYEVFRSVLIDLVESLGGYGEHKVLDEVMLLFLEHSWGIKKEKLQ